MRTRQQSTKGWVIFAAFCAVLFCMTVLRACAAKTAPEGCSLERVRPTQSVCFPLGTNGWRVSDTYGWRTDPLTGEETFHRGTDLACAEGTQVLAVMDGVVSAARRSTTYGNYLRLSHSGGQETLYAHLQYLFVRAGRWCRRASRWAQQGRPAAPPGHTSISSFLSRASAMTPGRCWVCHEAACPGRAAGLP